MEASKRFAIKQNVTLRVLDKTTGKLIRQQKGHNAATNSLIEGIGHYLAGAGVLRQGYSMLSKYIPKYISLGTMGLMNQDEDDEGLPTGISGYNVPLDPTEEDRFQAYMDQMPGYGSDGYSGLYNNERPYFGLGPAYTSFSILDSYMTDDIVYYNGRAYRATEDMIVDPDEGIYNIWNSDKWEELDEPQQPDCFELISPEFPRVEISFRDVVPEYEAENPRTIDVVFSAMISTGALQAFRDPDKDYIFITEAGLWSDRSYVPDDSGTNGLVAGYRVAPPSRLNWYMKAENVPDTLAIAYLHDQGIDDPTAEQIEEAKDILATENRSLLKQQVLRVERNQVVQVIWKIEVGNYEAGDLVVGGVPEEIRQQIEELFALVQSSALYASDVSVPVSSWNPSSVQPGYNYSADITVPGIGVDIPGTDPSIVSSYFTIVQFKDTDNLDFKFSPGSTITTDTVTIYAKIKPNRIIVLPLIMGARCTQVVAS